MAGSFEAMAGGGGKSTLACLGPPQAVNREDETQRTAHTQNEVRGRLTLSPDESPYNRPAAPAFRLRCAGPWWSAGGPPEPLPGSRSRPVPQFLSPE